jgi:hypothetical protein
MIFPFSHATFFKDSKEIYKIINDPQPMPTNSKDESTIFNNPC